VIPIGAKPHYTEIHEIRRFPATIRAARHPEFIDSAEKAWRNPSYLWLPGIPVKSSAFHRLVTAVATLLVIGSAAPSFAQYVWLNEKGVKQYSDMPPPPSTPASLILKQPSGSTLPSAGSETPVAPPQAESATATKPPMTTAERNADFRKRHAEQAEKEKKAAEQAKTAAEKAKNCQRAREYQNALASGGRITRTDQSGERSFLTDEQRAQEIQDVNRVLQQCK
jgi:hypothetical protein